MNNSCYEQITALYAAIELAYDDLHEVIGRPELYAGRHLGIQILASRQALRLALTLLEDVQVHLAPPNLERPATPSMVSSLRPSQSPLTP